LWLEHGPFGKVPPPREQIDGNAQAFQALSDTEVLVLGTDGNLWLEHGPFGKVPPPREQIDGNVKAFQPAPFFPTTLIFVLGSDGNLWLEQAPFGNVPPTRKQVDGNVQSFQALDDNTVLVLGMNGNLWLEHAPFGKAPPSREQVDGNVALSPPVRSELSWTSLGTGSGTTSSGATECSYALNLMIRRDGTCRFWGFYTNRGDVPLITAPSQTFGISIVVLDTNGKGYSFSIGAQVPSAPQAGSTFTWDQTEQSFAIASNWEAIALRSYANYGYSNKASISDVLSEIESALVGVAKDVGIVVGAIVAVIALVGGGHGTGSSKPPTVNS
jgi:hypothetical protein